MIARQLTPMRRQILAADIATMRSHEAYRSRMAHWRTYYHHAKLATERADNATSEQARKRCLSEAAVCLALAIVARERHHA